MLLDDFGRFWKDLEGLWRGSGRRWKVLGKISMEGYLTVMEDVFCSLLFSFIFRPHSFSFFSCVLSVNFGKGVCVG